MTPQELEDFARALEKLILERYEKAFERFGNLKALYFEEQSRTNDLSRRVEKLTNSNKTLTSRNKTLSTQLAEAKEKVSRLDEKLCYLVEIITCVRQISPEMSARLDKIIDEVNPLLKNDI